MISRVAKRSGLCLESLARRLILLLHHVEEIERRTNPLAILLVHRFLDDGAHSVAFHRRPQVAIETHLEKAISILDRARLGNDDQKSRIGQKEEIDDVEREAGADVQEDVVGVDTSNLVQKTRLLKILEIGRGQMAVRATDEPEVRDAGVHDDIFDRRDTAADEISETHLGRAETQRGVEIGSTEIGVDEDDTTTSSREADAQAARDEALSDASLAATDGGRGLMLSPTPV